MCFIVYEEMEIYIYLYNNKNKNICLNYCQKTVPVFLFKGDSPKNYFNSFMQLQLKSPLFFKLVKNTWNKYDWQTFKLWLLFIFHLCTLLFLLGLRLLTIFFFISYLRNYNKKYDIFTETRSAWLYVSESFAYNNVVLLC